MDKLKPEDMQYGHHYRFRGQPERLSYMGRNWSGNGYWHQFAKIGGTAGAVWAEITDADLYMIEEWNDG